MQITGNFRIPAPRQDVWQGLNDPNILHQCIPGCESLSRLSDNEFEGRVVTKVGPVKAAFAGKVTLSDIDPPNSYVITGEGKGGVAGFAKGSARVMLIEEGRETLLSYVVEANVGGKMAQLGGRLIEATATKTAEDFFSRFSNLVAASQDKAPAGAAAAAEPIVPVGAEDIVEPRPSSRWPWLAAGVLVVIVVAVAAAKYLAG